MFRLVVAVGVLVAVVVLGVAPGAQAKGGVSAAVENLREGRQAAREALERVRKDPRRVRERAASRAAFGGLSAEDAADVLRGTEGVFASRRVKKLRLGEDERVRRYVNRHTAAVESTDGGLGALVSSLTPLLAEDTDGRLHEVDLSLAKRPDGGYAARNASVKVRFSRRADDGVGLTQSGVFFSIVGGGDEPATRVEEGVAYLDVLEDTDSSARRLAPV